MKKKYSLKRNEEIGSIVQKRRFVKNSSFVMYYQQNVNNNFMRVCISVGKKIGNAVVRNKTKRQVREMVTALFDFDLNYDLVIIVRNNYLENDFSSNSEKLNELYLKLISGLTLQIILSLDLLDSHPNSVDNKLLT